MMIMGFLYFLRDVTIYRFIVQVFVTLYTIIIYSIVNFGFLSQDFALFMNEFIILLTFACFISIDTYIAESRAKQIFWNHKREELLNNETFTQKLDLGGGIGSNFGTELETVL